MTFEIYKDADGKWRWRIRFANGKIGGDSGQGVVNKSDLLTSIDTIRSGAHAAATVEVEG